MFITSFQKFIFSLILAITIPHLLFAIAYKYEYLKLNQLELSPLCKTFIGGCVNQEKLYFYYYKIVNQMALIDRQAHHISLKKENQIKRIIQSQFPEKMRITVINFNIADREDYLILKKMSSKPSNINGFIFENTIYVPISVSKSLMIYPAEKIWPTPAEMEAKGLSISYGYWWWALWMLSVVLLVAVLVFYHFKFDAHNRRLLKKAGLEFDFDRLKSSNYFKYFLKKHKQQITQHRDLLFGIAHELRSPMTRIQFAIDMLLSETEKSTTNELKDSIEDSFDELDLLISELLDFTRFQRKGAQCNNEETTIGKIIECSIKKKQEIHKNIKFEAYIKYKKSITVDILLMERVFNNLLSNAARYAKTFVRISVKTSRGKLVIYVDDDGVGVPPGKMRRIFEPFTRVDMQESIDSGSKGLGLAIAKSVIRLHRGSICVKNNPFGGARFIIILPL